MFFSRFCDSAEDFAGSRYTIFVYNCGLSHNCHQPYCDVIVTSQTVTEDLFHQPDCKSSRCGKAQTSTRAANAEARAERAKAAMARMVIIFI